MEFPEIRASIINVIRGSEDRHGHHGHNADLLSLFGVIRRRRAGRDGDYRISVQIKTLSVLGVDIQSFSKSVRGRMDREGELIYVEDNDSGETFMMSLAAHI